jgi:endonuclease/exonuclease/phosphatase family metal-dependent hydrolase
MPETGPVPPEIPAERLSKRWARKVFSTKTGRVGLAALAAAGVGTYKFDPFDWRERSGRLYEYDPPPALIERGVDEDFRVVTWNMHGELLAHLPEILEIGRNRKTDVFSLQEVSFSEFAELRNLLTEGWHVRYVIADSNAELLSDGTRGNVLMTRQPPEKESTFTLEGSDGVDSVVETGRGLRDDLFEIPENGIRFDDTVAGKQEDRAVLVETIQVWDADEGEPRDIKIIGTHIAGPRPFHDEQLAGLKEIIEDEIEEDTPLVVAGDLNADREEARNFFLDLEMDASLTDEEIFPNPQAGHQADYIGVYPADILGVAEVTPLRKYRTDHVAIEARMDTDSSRE